MYYLPSSPRWLLMKKRRIESIHSLSVLRQTTATNVEIEVNEIERSIREQRAVSLKALFADSAIRRCMIIGCGLVVFQQLTGE